MSWLAGKLRNRVQIRRIVQSPNDEGGYDVSYTTLGTVWAEVLPITSERQGIAAFANYVRGVNVTSWNTHTVKLRRVAVETLGREVSLAFSTAFKVMADLSLLKDDYYIFLQHGSTVEGQLFKVTGYEDRDARREWLKIFCKEIEEQGAGAAA